MNRYGQSQEDNEWSELAGTSFAKDWDNEKDAVYDDWMEHYKVAGDKKDENNKR